MAELASAVEVLPVLLSELSDARVAGAAANIDIDGLSFDFLWNLKYEIL